MPHWAHQLLPELVQVRKASTQEREAQGSVGQRNWEESFFRLLVCLGRRNFPLEPKELSTPTLLLWGEKDNTLQQGLVEAIGSHFVPGRLESHILPGSGHWIPQSHPQEMHQYMWAFLQDLLG